MFLLTNSAIIADAIGKKKAVKDSKPLNSIIITVLGSLLLLGSPSLRAKAQSQSWNSTFDRIIKTIAEKHGLEPGLIHSLIYAESNYDPYAVSSKGAMGLMQLMPETAKMYGVRNPFDPRENIEGGVRYLKDLSSLYYRQTDLVLAAYNAGQEAIKKYGGVPPFPETRNYIEKVMAKYPTRYIKRGTKIYKFYNDSGGVVLTNCPYYIYSLNKEKAENN